MFASESTTALLIVRGPRLVLQKSKAIPFSGPPRQGDFDELIRSNLSWSQFAGPVPAGWRERFLQDRRWELSVERRVLDEYSDEERKAEYAALESQRSHLGVFLRMESNAPPRLQRKRPIPLPLSTPSPLVLNTLPCEEGAESKHERSLSSCQPTHRPSLHVTIPGTEQSLPWLDGSIRDSPLVCFTEPHRPHACH